MKKHAFLILLAVFFTGCATSPQQRSEQAPAQLEPGIYATETGERLSPDELYDRLADYQFVVVGERHDDPWAHEVEARVLRGVAQRTDQRADQRAGSVALGMEMFQRPFQDALDAYVEGDVDEEEMLERTEWETRWGFQTDSYRRLWRFAREQGFPVVALNARRELSKEISRVGLEGLSEDERADVPQLDLDNDTHRAYVRRAFEQHGMEMSEERFERFYTAQVLWDETMAETAVEFVRARGDVDTMVIVAGGAHAHKGFGIPPRIERRLERPTGDDVVTVLPVNLGRREQPAQSLEEFADAADYVWVDALDAARASE